MVFISNWLCAIAIVLFAAVVQSQVQETSTKPPPPPQPFTANDQCKYDFMSSHLLFVVIAAAPAAI